MPRYFFHVTDGSSVRDDEGTELPDIYTAQAEAIRMSGEILRDMGAKFWNGIQRRHDRLRTSLRHRQQKFHHKQRIDFRDESRLLSAPAFPITVVLGLQFRRCCYE